MSKKEMVNVRVPKILFDELERVINQVPITESDGTLTRISEPYGLTSSNTALVNTVLLSLLSTVVSQSRVTLLTQITPGVNMTYVNEAKRRLVPDQSLNIPVNEIVDISRRQQDGFNRLASALEKMYVAQQQSDNRVIEDQGALLQLLSYWVGANSQANVSDSSTYNDNSAAAVRKAIEVYGDQHLTNFHLDTRQAKVNKDIDETE